MQPDSFSKAFLPKKDLNRMKAEEDCRELTGHDLWNAKCGKCGKYLASNATHELKRI